MFPTTNPVSMRDVLDVGVLVNYLASSARERPVVVLTIAEGASKPYVSAAKLSKKFGSAIDVVTLPSKDLTFALSDRVGKESSAFLGACRVYPVGDAWSDSPRAVPLRLARTQSEQKDLQGLIETDVRAALTASGTSVAEPNRRKSRQSRDAQVPTPQAPRDISTTGEAAALAHHLRSMGRRRPTVVVTRASGASAAYADLNQVRSDLAGLADVVEITTSEASWAFSREVPDMCQVYGGAARVYPIGDDWTQDPYLSPLRFAYGPSDRAEVSRQLVSDALSMAARGGLTLGKDDDGPKPVTAVVQGVAGDRGFVMTSEGGTGVLWPELVEPGVAADRLFQKGMRVTGTIDPVSRRIDLAPDRLSAAEALAPYTDGVTVLGRVSAVDERGCDVELFPGEVRRVAAEDLTDEGLPVASLVAVGDVVPLWLGVIGDQWVLSVADAADPSEALPAPAILRGGPPWLIPQATTALEHEDHTTQEPIPNELEDVEQRERSQLVQRLRGFERQVELLQQQLRDSRTRLREAEKRLKRRQGQVPSTERLFERDEDQMEFEIRDRWARMTSPSEKAARPLRAWTYGPEFFKTVGEVEGVSRDKIVEVLVHVLTGLDAELASRELHQLRTGMGGEDPPVTRAGGETAWRVSLQVNSPSARRLHYWRCQDGSIEFSSIRVHDDFRV